jgi:hypothetical protein
MRRNQSQESAQVAMRILNIDIIIIIVISARTGIARENGAVVATENIMTRKHRQCPKIVNLMPR